MPQFTTTDSLQFRSFLVAHGVDAATAEKVAAKVQRKMQRNKPLTAEESALVDGFLIKARISSGAGANVSQKVSPWPSKWKSPSFKTGYTDTSQKVMPGSVKYSNITLKKGYIDTSQKVSEMSFKYFRPKPSGGIQIGDRLTSLSNKATPLSNKAQMLSNKAQMLSNKATPLSNKAQKVSVYSPGTVRQLAYKVASS